MTTARPNDHLAPGAPGGDRKSKRDTIVEAAARLIRTEGVHAASISGLIKESAASAGTIYHHFANKEALLDAMVDRVYAEITLPLATGDWRHELRTRSFSVREVLHRHPWALPFLESRRTPGPANMAYHDANIGCMRAAGFTAAQASQAYSVLDAFVYGFLLQELSLPFESGTEAVAMVTDEPFGDLLADYPHMAWFVSEVILQPGYSYDREFEPGLDLVIDGIAKAVSG